ncbi:hypothetical protein PanWU01x14_248940 [Parasponia andersonii]|uniref:Uncharacterized protein n=1 Tax=Parasponia andersonii TaxID=3476 RepID=A0A2P5BDC2_PARAD|nr:hypothetical protein PanWU01x14_248940 [Parasponia andersonii]
MEVYIDSIYIYESYVPEKRRHSKALWDSKDTWTVGRYNINSPETREQLVKTDPTETSKSISYGFFLTHAQASEKDDLICFNACAFDTIWRPHNDIIFRNDKIDPAQLKIDSHNRYVEMSKCGIAGIFRDDHGSILLLTFKSDIATSPLEAECMAIQMVLITALEKGGAERLWNLMPPLWSTH